MFGPQQDSTRSAGVTMTTVLAATVAVGDRFAPHETLDPGLSEQPAGTTGRTTVLALLPRRLLN